MTGEERFHGLHPYEQKKIYQGANFLRLLKSAELYSTSVVGSNTCLSLRPALPNQRAIKAKRLAITLTQEQGRRKPLIIMKPRADEFN